MTLAEWIVKLGDVNSSKLPIILGHEAIELKEYLIELQRLRQLKHNLDCIFGGENND